VELLWDNEKQYYTGEAVDGKAIEVSDEVMNAMLFVARLRGSDELWHSLSNKLKDCEGEACNLNSTDPVLWCANPGLSFQDYVRNIHIWHGSYVFFGNSFLSLNLACNDFNFERHF
jgi:hypothetical protein